MKIGIGHTSSIYLFFVFMAWFGSLAAQQPLFNDSVVHVINQNPQDSVRLHILYNIISITPQYDTAKIDFLLQHIETITKKPDGTISSENYFSIGNVYENKKNDLSTAEKYYEIAIAVAMEEQNPNQAKYEGWLGYLLLKKGDTEKAMGYLLKAREDAETKQLKNILPRTYLLLAFGLKETNDLTNASHYLQKSIDASLKIADSSMIHTALHELGNIYILKKDFNNAIIYHKKALAIREKKSDKSDLIYSYHDIAIDYENIDSLETSRVYFLKSEQLAEKTENTWLLFRIASSIFDVLERMGKKNEAEIYLKKMENLAKILDIKTAYYTLNNSYYYYYSNLGDYKNALYYFKTAIAYHDSIFNEDIQKNIVELEKKYESAKTDKVLVENQDQIKQQNMIIMFVLSGAAIIVFFLVLVLIQYRQKKAANILLASQNQEINKQKEELLVQSENLQLIYNQLLEQRNEIEIQREKLFELNATKDKFFSIMAHDLKNPFNSLLGMSELLTQGTYIFTPEKVQKYAQSMHLSAKQAYDLLENLLEWSRLQTGKLTPVFTSATPSLLISEVKLLLDPAAQAKSIHLMSDVMDDDAIVVDLQMTRTVLRNLVTNALKFTFPEGTILIECKKHDKEMIFIVSDTGTGIEPEHIDKLFRIDSKLSKSGTAEEKGTGLGLILCKEFVEIQRGRIWVESKTGKGSKFSFSIPVSE